jgi:hypothetical protein
MRVGQPAWLRFEQSPHAHGGGFVLTFRLAINWHQLPSTGINWHQLGRGFVSPVFLLSLRERVG